MIKIKRNKIINNKSIMIVEAIKIMEIEIIKIKDHKEVSSHKTMVDFLYKI